MDGNKDTVEIKLEKMEQEDNEIQTEVSEGVIIWQPWEGINQKHGFKVPNEAKKKKRKRIFLKKQFKTVLHNIALPRFTHVAFTSVLPLYNCSSLHLALHQLMLMTN